MHNDQGLPRQCLVHEDVAPAVGSEAVLQVLPVSEGVDCLIGADFLQEVAGRLPGNLVQFQ